MKALIHKINDFFDADCPVLITLTDGTVEKGKIIATFVQSGLLHESMYKRIQGFFTEFKLCLDQVASFVLLILLVNGNYR